MFFMVYYSKVLSSSANELQQNSNAPFEEEYTGIPQIMTAS